MAEPRSSAEEARDPSTPPERLLELTEKHPQLQRTIVLNPSCPEVARSWILATNPWAKKAYDEAMRAAEPS
ncbi:variant leucine-rich repeat-containing protein, partial [Brachybacterium alimentarium]